MASKLQLQPKKNASDRHIKISFFKWEKRSNRKSLRDIMLTCMKKLSKKQIFFCQKCHKIGQFLLPKLPNHFYRPFGKTFLPGLPVIYRYRVRSTQNPNDTKRVFIVLVAAILIVFIFLSTPHNVTSTYPGFILRSASIP